jgi:hypothetical protein
MTNDTKVSDGCREVVFRIVIREVDGAPRVVESGVWPVSEPQRPALGDAKAIRRYYTTAVTMGFVNAPMWDELAEETKDMYRT